MATTLHQGSYAAEQAGIIAATQIPNHLLELCADSKIPVVAGIGALFIKECIDVQIPKQPDDFRFEHTRSRENQDEIYNSTLGIIQTEVKEKNDNEFDKRPSGALPFKGPCHGSGV